MLGDISPQTVKITSQAVVYPGRDHVTALNVKRFSGRQYSAVDLSLLTRAVLVFPQNDPVIAYDTATAPAGTITWVGSDITIDLSDFSMPASVQSSYLIVYDAEHLGGQVLVDDNDSVVEFDFRNVSVTGIIQPPVLELVSEAPADDATYGRKNGTWVSIDAVVAGVSSVNGFTGTVVLDAADVGAEATGAVAAGIAAHEADTTPHTTLLNLTKVAFNTAAGASAGNAGEVVWNNTDMTLDIGVGGGVTLQAGQELQVRGLNNSGSTMLNGQAVFISGASGNRLVFSKAQANQVTADKTIAVLTQDIPNNQQGQATVIGLVRDLNTSGFAEGIDLWLSSTVLGGLTATKPPPPDNAVRIGYVVRSHATLGSIFVRIQNIEQLDELHNLNIINPLDGDIIEYDSATSTWINVPNTGGAGEANTASNLGAGTGVFASKVVADLQFKSLVAGTGVTLTPTATEITITASGAGGAVDSVNGLTGVVVLNTDHIAEDGAPVNLWFTNARASAAAPVQTVDGQTGTVSLTASYAPLSHVGDGGAAHANAIAAGAAGFMTGADKTKLDGVATGANLYVHPNHSGDVTSVADGAQTIAANAVTNTKLADMATQTIKGRTTAATGDPEDLTAAQVRTLINVANGATALPAVATFTGNKTLALTDINTYNVSQDGTAQAVTVPAQATVVWTADAEIHIEQGGAGTVTVTGATGVTINGVSAGSFALAGQFSAVTLKRTGSDAWTLIGVPSFFYDRSNILGTVSQSAGVPTGAIIERGSNANGEYVRYADGTQICTRRVTAIGPVSTASGALFVSGAVSPGAFSASFTADPVLSAASNNPSGHASWVQQIATQSTTDHGTYVLTRATTIAATDFRLEIIALGRWF